MIKSFRLPLVASCLLALPSAALADDAALAARLVGTWEGRWEYGETGGKLMVDVKAASGNSLRGETTWYGTAVGDFRDRFSGAKLKDGKLKASESTMDFEALVSEDGTAMEGKWTSPAGSGPLKLRKKASSPDSK